MRSRLFDQLKSHLIRGKRFRLRWRCPPAGGPGSKGKRGLGRCDCPGDARPEIFISPDVGAPLTLLGTVIHECAHAAFFDLEDAAVRQYEDDLMRLLCRMGVQVSFTGRPRKFE